MSMSIRRLRAAIHEFAATSADEVFSESEMSELGDALSELEAEIELLYDPPEERARFRAEADERLSEAIAEVTRTFGRQRSEQ
jgi:cell division protein FtsB